jgi:DNA-binding winged helix-turn-helix (wHTH) protein
MQYAARPTSEAASSAVGWPAEAPLALDFRTYRLFPRARLLLDGSRPVPLGGRAFDLLHALLCARGKVVSKPDLMARVWPTTYVDESNLRFQIACVRRALAGDAELIKTVPGRGYLLAEELPQDGDSGESLAQLSFAARASLSDQRRAVGNSDASEVDHPSKAVQHLLELLVKEIASAQLRS